MATSFMVVAGVLAWPASRWEWGSPSLAPLVRVGRRLASRARPLKVPRTDDPSPKFPRASAGADGGPAAAFEAEARPHLERLQRVARRLANGREDAADLLQETLLRAFRTWSSFRAGTDSRAWLFTILYSVFSNRWQQRRRRPLEVSLQALEERFERELAAPDWDDPLARLEAGRHGAGEAIDAALAELPPEFAATVVLVDVEELTYEEAAQVLSCPIGTVRSRLARGRRLLAALLRDYARGHRLLRSGDR
jgi:RNA polymerase sigma-70 factor (ECF subfamily)